MKTTLLAVAALSATTSLAMAQDKVEITFSGTLSVADTTFAGRNEQYFDGNSDVRFRNRADNGVKFGADLGVETFQPINNPTGTSVTAHYATAVLENQFGKVSIGMPRSIKENYFTVPKIGGTELLDLNSPFLSTDSFRTFKNLLNQSGEEIYGARYDGKIGQIALAASINRFSDNSGNLDEIVAHYDGNDWSMSLGATVLNLDGFSITNTTLEVQGRNGKISGGIVLETSDQNSFGPDTARVFVSYDFNDEIKLNTQVLHYQITGRGVANTYGIDLSYTHKSGAFLTAGVVDYASSNDKRFNVILGYTF
jgi:hypothetical protein